VCCCMARVADLDELCEDRRRVATRAAGHRSDRRDNLLPQGLYPAHPTLPRRCNTARRDRPGRWTRPISAQTRSSRFAREGASLGLQGGALTLGATDPRSGGPQGGVA